MGEQIVTLSLGKSKVVSFQIIPDEVRPVANIIVEDLVITPSKVYVGDLVTITVRYWPLLRRKYG